MYPFDEGFIAEMSGFKTLKQRKSLLDYYHKMSENERVEASRRRNVMFFKMKNRWYSKEKSAEYDYCLLLLVIAEMRQIEFAPENRNATLEDIRLRKQERVQRLKEEKAGRVSPRRKAIESYFNDIHELRSKDNLSFPEIAKYLTRYYPKAFLKETTVKNAKGNVSYKDGKEVIIREASLNPSYLRQVYIELCRDRNIEPTLILPKGENE